MSTKTDRPEASVARKIREINPDVSEDNAIHMAVQLVDAMRADGWQTGVAAEGIRPITANTRDAALERAVRLATTALIEPASVIPTAKRYALYVAGHPVVGASVVPQEIIDRADVWDETDGAEGDPAEILQDLIRHIQR